MGKVPRSDTQKNTYFYYVSISNFLDCRMIFTNDYLVQWTFAIKFKDTMSHHEMIFMV